VTTCEREWLSVREVAAELGCSEPTVRRRIREGQLPAVRLGGPGSPIRIPRAGLEAWLWSTPSEENN
jgi:excisionase family DNA binding protein